MALVIPIVTITGGINPLRSVILKPNNDNVPNVQTTTIPMMIIEKSTARNDRKKTNMINPVIIADA
jgi:hypothetical protein